MHITNRFSSKKTLTAGILLTLILELTVGVASAAGFERWPVITLDGEGYYMAGAPDGPNGETDVPGHYWVQAGPNKLVAKHYNTGPFGAPQWWSSDAPDGELLYMAQVIIDTWSPEKAEAYAARGYVHYHEFVSVADGSLHPTKVGWFKHIARTSFTLDGGPGPAFYHSVTPGVDYEFIPNWMKEYSPEE
jgi:selenium-binding protein 1